MENPTTDTLPSTAPAVTVGASDRSFDLSLRLLTALVLAALGGSLGLLAYRWLAPHLASENPTTYAGTSGRVKTAPAASDAGPARGDEVLMQPGHVFRCEEQGVASFSDQNQCSGPGKDAASSAPAGSTAIAAPATKAATAPSH